MAPFGSAIGGDPLQEAIQRRNQGQVGTTAQVSPTAPTAVNQVPPTPQVSGQSMPTGSSLPTSTPQGQGLPAESPESTIIIKALDSRLKSLSKIQGA